jgi:hypothetical protein|tara:strand:+ start:3045 stop:3548 length:504 start_codon:yes stop_codon:yes gene_type:complete
MALKGDRYEALTDISFFWNTSTTATRGGVACLQNAGSGVALDQSAAKVEYSSDPSGKVPVGLLLNDVVNIDQTRQHINYHKNEAQLGGKITMLQQGWIVTDFVYPGITPTAGRVAYLNHSGYLQDTLVDSGDLKRTPPVGRFMSNKDEDGYAKVFVSLPQVHGGESA